MTEKRLTVGVGITGSFNKVSEVIPVIEGLKQRGYQLKVFITEHIKENDEIVEKIEGLIEDKVLTSIEEVEPYGPSKSFDVMLIAPLTGTSMGKLSNGINDNAVLMAAKGVLRNNKPVVLAMSTNDALGINGTNLMKLIITKNIYFVPFGQDDPVNKPNSLVADFSKIDHTITQALKGKQVQPIIIVRQKRDDD